MQARIAPCSGEFRELRLLVFASFKIFLAYRRESVGRWRSGIILMRVACFYSVGPAPPDSRNGYTMNIDGPVKYTERVLTSVPISRSYLLRDLPRQNRGPIWHISTSQIIYCMLSWWREIERPRNRCDRDLLLWCRLQLNRFPPSVTSMSVGSLPGRTGSSIFSVVPTRSSASQGIGLTAASGDLKPTRRVAA